MHPATSTTCSNCGQSAPANSRFCTHCGSPLGAATDATINLAPGSEWSAPAEPAPQVPTFEPRNAPNPLNPPVPAPIGSDREWPTPQERNWALFCHLSTLIGWVVPFADLVITGVIWATQKDTSAFVGYHAKQALNYQIVFYVSTLIAAILTTVLIGFPLLILLIIIDVTVPIYMAIKASKGETRPYPYVPQLIQ